MKNRYLTIVLSLVGVMGFSQGKFFGGDGDGYARQTVTNVTLSNTSFIKEDVSLKLYPNPVETGLNIILPDVDCAVVSIYDLKGRLIQKQKWNNKSLDVSYLSSGIYVLKMNNNSQLFIKE
jgi:hypothetical protein